MTDTISVPRELLQTLLDAADAGISIKEQDADDAGAEPEDRVEWAAEAALWTRAVTEGLALLAD